MPNLSLRWHILRSYRFVAEVTFIPVYAEQSFFTWKDTANSGGMQIPSH